MRRALIILGRCRAGGAAVAECAQALGYSMGRAFASPAYPDLRLDFEDAELSTWLAEHTESGWLAPFWPRVPWKGFEEYLAEREAHSQAMGFDGRMGFKGPLLALHSWMLERFLVRRLGQPPLRVVVTRAEEAIERSIARQGGADVLRRWNGLIGVIDAPTDLTIAYEALVENPAREVARLALALGVEDPVTVARAAARVAMPCS